MKALYILNLLLALLMVTGKTAAQNDNALLWQVTGPGIIRPSYVFGTMHLLCPDLLVVPEAVQAAFEQSEKICLEIDLDDPEFHQKMQKGMSLPPGKSLRDYCPPGTYSAIDSFFQYRMHTTIEPYLYFKPMVMMQTLYVTMLGCQPVSWERLLSEMAADRQKEVTGLETVEMQVAFFDSIPLSKQVEWISVYVDDMEKMAVDFHKMVEMYKVEKVDSLTQLIKKSPEMSEYSDLLLDRRNRKWIDQIIGQAAEDPTFFAVGAGHLGGKSGVIQLLRDKGFTVTAIK